LEIFSGIFPKVKKNRYEGMMALCTATRRPAVITLREISAEQRTRRYKDDKQENPECPFFVYHD